MPDPEINGLLDTMPESKFTNTPVTIPNKLSDTMPNGSTDAMSNGLPEAAPKNMPGTTFNESDAVPMAITTDGLKPATLEDVQQILAESQEELRKLVRQEEG